MLSSDFRPLLLIVACTIGLLFPEKVVEQRPSSGPGSAAGAEEKAIEFLSREVPAWFRGNGCFSCHNNGDGARALYTATRKGYSIARTSLDDTTAWLSRPAHWEENKGDPGFSDKRLGDVQFAAALSVAIESGHITDKRPLVEAARRLITSQGSDGSWPIEPAHASGSPATYGTPLATLMALDTLRKLPQPATRDAIARAERWFSRLTPKSTLDVAALLLSQTGTGTQSSRTRENLEMMRNLQNGDGGWGLYRGSRSETFDTAIALLALTRFRNTRGINSRIDRGRSFLLAEQESDGGWPATTRPSGGESYAQRLSTTGWATIALLETGSRVKGPTAPQTKP